MLLRVFLSTVLLLLTAGAAWSDAVPVPEILVTDSQALVLPAFHDADKAGVEVKDLFAELPTAPTPAWPVDDGAWSSLNATDGVYTLALPNAGAAAQHLVFYVRADRWQEATLKIKSDLEMAFYLGEEKLSLGAADEDGWRSATVQLPIGKSRVAAKVLLEAGSENEPTLAVALEPAEGAAVTATTDRRHCVTIQTILNAPRVGQVSISPDGRFTLLAVSEYRDGQNQERWLEIRETKTLDLVRYLRGPAAPARVSWYPGQGDATALTWTTVQDGKSTIWLHNLAAGEAQPVLEDIEDMGRWEWASDGESIVYEVERDTEPDPRRVKHVANPADRQPWWRGRAHLMQAFLDDRIPRRLTAGPLNPDGWELAPDGGSLIFFTREGDWTHRPFHTTRLWQLDLGDLSVRELLNEPWIGGATFSPDGRTLCLTGSPSAFDGLGRNLPDGVQPNDYGGQVYLMDLEDLQPHPVSVDFRPDVGWVHWSRADGKIYALCTDTQYSNVYRYDVKKDRWEKVESGVEYTDQIALADKGSLAVVRGTSANRPNTVQVVDLKSNKVRGVHDPGEAWYDGSGIVFGKVETWKADLDGGEELDGMVYYPPNFDPAQKYPLIVYYYGGTSPVTRDFGGRYPKNVWAGQGYVVYVPEPSGATGYGQEMAARHVNDWGKITAGEVIAGTKQFLAEHDFVMPDRVGCIGASYGGFLTEYIITQTDIFAAAVSHAGISSISSYWGEGMWGYSYGARALANSFPWQDRELFIEQSALFHADKIHTPLLLVHGDSDINVPLGESDQLFTALKILGREVQYVQITGQDHHILDHEQRIVWNDTILAFFAKHLKQQDAWWDDMYPEPEDYR